VQNGKEQTMLLRIVQKVNIPVSVGAIFVAAVCIEKLDFWNSKHHF
jgi:hypothetical protein